MQKAEHSVLNSYPNTAIYVSNTRRPSKQVCSLRHHVYHGRGALRDNALRAKSEGIQERFATVDGTSSRYPWFSRPPLDDLYCEYPSANNGSMLHGWASGELESLGFVRVIFSMHKAGSD